MIILTTVIIEANTKLSDVNFLVKEISNMTINAKAKCMKLFVSHVLLSNIFQ